MPALNRNLVPILCLPVILAAGLLAGCGSSDETKSATTTESRSASGSIASKDVAATVCNDLPDPLEVRLTSADPETETLRKGDCMSTVPYDSGGKNQALEPCSIRAYFSLPRPEPRPGSSTLDVTVFFMNDVTVRGFALGACSRIKRETEKPETSGFWPTSAEDPPICLVIADDYYLEVDQRPVTPGKEVPFMAVVGAGRPNGCKPLSSGEV